MTWKEKLIGLGASGAAVAFIAAMAFSGGVTEQELDCIANSKGTVADSVIAECIVDTDIEAKAIETLYVRNRLVQTGLEAVTADTAAPPIVEEGHDRNDIPAVLSDTPVKDALALIENASYRADVKGAAWQDVGTSARHEVDKYDVEIVDVEVIDGGVTVFARAWDAEGKQIGFGTDGTVDIERFRFFNPPILVPDGTKSTVTDELGTHETDNFKEDVNAAIEQSLAHTISVLKLAEPNIVEGKVGSTVSTFYPNAHAETESVDGNAAYNGTGLSWATLHDATAGTDSTDSNAVHSIVYLTAGTTTNQWTGNTRAFYLFSTSAIGIGQTITNAVLSVYLTNKYVDFAAAQYLVAVSSNPASNTAITTADYDQFGTTIFATSAALSGISTGAYMNLTLDANGILNISPTGVSKFAVMLKKDVENSSAWENGKTCWIEGYFADQTGTTNDPKLVVTHAASSTFVPKIIIH